MGRNITSYLLGKKGIFLAIFPHADDASFVAGGLFQQLQKQNFKTKLLCLTSDDKKEELEASCSELGIDELDRFDFKKGELIKNKKLLEDKIKKEIEMTKPFSVLTFDPGGVTGNTDHSVSSITVLNLFEKMDKNRPDLLWRISDEQEKEYFKSGNGDQHNTEPSFYYFLKLKESIKKLKAIFKHKDKFKNLLFKMRIIEWYLFDHKELYYLVDYGNNKYNIIEN